MSDDDGLEEEVRYELVMPFIACQSEGGPYDDDGFSAGFMCGVIYEALHSGVEELWHTVRTDLLPQLDLVAMSAGYKLEVEESSDDLFDDWSHVKFTKLVSLDAAS